MLPVIPQAANNWLQSPNAQAALGAFPPNLVQYLPEDTQKAILLWISTNYAWPQVMERLPFENMWKNILEMYRIKLNIINTSIDEASPAGRKEDEETSTLGDQVRVADSVFFDAVERLTNIHHFVSFKEGLPIQFNIPKYYDTRSEDAFYHPFRDRIKAANALLSWNFDNEDIFRKHAIIARHFYTYGVAFARSEFSFVVSQVQRMMNTGQQAMMPEITEIGTTFDPLSIRKLWLNYRLNAYDMNYQPCPFMMEETPRFATLQHQYNPQINPFGFLNLDKVMQAPRQWMYSEPELHSVREALQGVIASNPMWANGSLPDILDPKYSVEALWTFYPMLPLDPQTGEWMQHKDGSPVQYFRYILNTFGANLSGGNQIMLRLQRNFYPWDQLPLYGTTHMPDLDSGLYCPSLGYLIWNHYKEVITCKGQYITNKDWINNPPAWVLASSPATSQNLSKPGAKIEVNSPNDFGWRVPYDATQSTVQMMEHLRDQAKTSTKSEDSLLGKAMGGRTSASEAQNVFQASMSAVTTPINIFNYDIMGGFATRVWEYTGTWFPPELLKSITGQMGFVLTPEDLWTRVGLKWDIGSTYIESIVRQQNIRYMLESSMGDPSVNRAPMWRELLEEWRFDTANEWVNDGGLEREIYIATNQAIETFYGKQVMVNPDQNHQVAIKVKTRFLEDQDSIFMTQFRNMAPLLVKQIQVHQQFLMVQMHQQMLQAQLGIPPGASPTDNTHQSPALPAAARPPTPGSIMQTAGPPIA
jgi:hypothetical protein